MIDLNENETIRTLLDKGRSYLAADSARNSKNSVLLDCRLLLGKVLGVDSTYLFSNPGHAVSKDKAFDYASMLEKRALGFCVASIIGEKEFYNRIFNVSTDTLIPRPDSETIVEQALKHCKSDMAKILDICTGSGCIGITIASELKKRGMQYELTLSDISEKALSIARSNCKKFAVDARIVRSDLFSSIEGTFDLITANPPYIRNDEYDFLDPEVQNEPKIALVSPNNGIYHISEIIKNATHFLNKDSTLLVEIGYTQGEDAKKQAMRYGYRKISVEKDLNQLDRVFVATV